MHSRHVISNYHHVDSLEIIGEEKFEGSLEKSCAATQCNHILD